MEKILNFRKLADGMKNKDGLEIKGIYRSGDVSCASEEDIKFLIDEHIVNITDLRNKGEISRQPYLEHEGLKRRQVDVMNDAKESVMNDFTTEDMYNLLVKLYREDYVTTDGFKDEMDYILSLEGEAFLFHCTGGKDRTGITGMILMYVLDFSPEQIREEYLRIDQRIIKEIQNHLIENYANHLGEQINDKFIEKTANVNDQLIDTYINSMLKQFKTVDNYIENKIELSEEKIKKLKDYYLI